MNVNKGNLNDPWSLEDLLRTKTTSSNSQNRITPVKQQQKQKKLISAKNEITTVAIQLIEPLPDSDNKVQTPTSELRKSVISRSKPNRILTPKKLNIAEHGDVKKCSHGKIEPVKCGLKSDEDSFEELGIAKSASRRSSNSSISWAKDAHEVEQTMKLGELWADVEQVCSGGLRPFGMSDTVYEECKDWKNAFPVESKSKKYRFKSMEPYLHEKKNKETPSPDSSISPASTVVCSDTNENNETERPPTVSKEVIKELIKKISSIDLLSGPQELLTVTNRHRLMKLDIDDNVTSEKKMNYGSVTSRIKSTDFQRGGKNRPQSQRQGKIESVEDKDWSLADLLNRASSARETQIKAEIVTKE